MTTARCTRVLQVPVPVVGGDDLTAGTCLRNDHDKQPPSVHDRGDQEGSFNAQHGTSQIQCKEKLGWAMGQFD